MKKKIVINGFGRIGRIAYRMLLGSSDYEVVAINSHGTAEDAAYLLKYDSVYRTLNEEVVVTDGGIKVDEYYTKVLQIDDPSLYPWQELDVDLVLECTGKFVKEEDAMKHITAGAKHVIISAPAKGNVKTVVYGVNDDILEREDKIISSASCTTNCLAPVLKVINSRRGRTSATNIVPTSTGAASAIGLVIPSLSGKMDGVAYRVPVSDGSVVDVVLNLKRETSVDEINSLFKDNQSEVLEFTLDPVVSSDVITSSKGALVDGLSTKVLSANQKQIKVVAWYDNEYGYTAQMLRVMDKLLKL